MLCSFPCEIGFFSGERPGRRLRVYSGLSSAQETPTDVVGGPRRAVPTSSCAGSQLGRRHGPGTARLPSECPSKVPSCSGDPRCRVLLRTSRFPQWPREHSPCDLEFCSEPLQAQAKYRPLPFCFEVPLIMKKRGEIPNQGYKIMYVV